MCAGTGDGKADVPDGGGCRWPEIVVLSLDNRAREREVVAVVTGG